MDKSKKQIIASVAIIITLGAVFLFFQKNNRTSKEPAVLGSEVTGNTAVNLDSFAKCITESGAKFYGAYWCSHCQNQKKSFGDSKQYLPYVECSNPDGQTQTQVCKDKGIQGYPTWIFADGSQQSGDLSFQQLSQKTGCAIPK